MTKKIANKAENKIIEKNFKFISIVNIICNLIYKQYKKLFLVVIALKIN